MSLKNKCIIDIIRVFLTSDNSVEPVKLPIEYKRIPNGKKLLFSIELDGYEFGRGSSDFYLVYPNAKRSFWSIWVVNFDLSSEFVNQRYKAIPLGCVDSKEQDSPLQIAYEMLSKMLENEMYFGLYQISSIKSGILGRAKILNLIKDSKHYISEFFKYKKGNLK